MFDVVITFVPAAQAAAIRSIAVPVCRVHGYDDVLPDVEEQDVQYTMLRPPVGLHGDAADGFAATVKHDGLVIVTHRTAVSARLVLPPTGGNGPNRFPWHPWCQRFAPRGCSISKAVLQEAAARQHLRQHQQQLQQQAKLAGANISASGGALQQQQQQQQQHQKQKPVLLVPIALHDDPAFLQDLAAAVVHHNNSIMQQQQQQPQVPQENSNKVTKALQEFLWKQQEQQAGAVGQQRRQAPAVLVTPLLLQTVVQAAAAVAVQSSWRAHRSRLVNRIAERALLNRAVRVIQRAWKAFMLRQRLRLLSTVAAAWHSAQHLKYSSLLCVDVGSRRLADEASERGRTSTGLFPEHRLRFVIDNDGSLFLVDMSNSNIEDQETVSSNNDGQQTPAAGCGGADTSTEQPVTSNRITTAATAAGSRPIGFPKWLGIDVPVISGASAAKILEDQLWFEPFSRADAAKLLEIGCDVKDILAPELVAEPRLCHSTDVAQLVTFKNKQQAAARAALLAALTYDVKTQSACRLLSVQDTPLGAAYRSVTSGDVTGRSNRPAAAAGVVPPIRLAVVAGTTATVTAQLTGRSSSRSHVVRAEASPAKSKVAAAGSGGSTARSAAELDAAAAVAAAATAVAALDGFAEGDEGIQQQQVIHQVMSVPLVPVKPTATLSAAAAAAAAAGSSADGASCAVTDDRLQFFTHVYSRFPHLQRLAAAAEAAAMSAMAADQYVDASSSTMPVVDAQAAEAVEKAAAMEEAAAADAGTGVFKPVHLLSDSKAYHHQVRLEQVNALRAKLAAEAAAAAATAATDLAAKQQAVAVARAAMAAVVAAAAGLEATDSASHDRLLHAQQLNSLNCISLGYWPSTVSMSAVESRSLKQQQQAAAAAVVAAVRQEIQEGRQSVLRQLAGAKAQLQMQGRIEIQALQQHLLQQECQQQAAAESRVKTLKAIRRAGAAARQQQQQVVGGFQRQCNRFSKHLKRGEFAAVRAAQQQAADIHTTQQRLMNEQASEITQQRHQETTSTLKLRTLQDKQDLKVMLAAAKSVADTEQAARRAQVAAAVLQEKAMLSTVGPAGGVWGPATAAEVLKSPAKMSLVGTVDTPRTCE